MLSGVLGGNTSLALRGVRNYVARLSEPVGSHPVNLCKNKTTYIKKWSFGVPGGNRTHNKALGGLRYIHLTTETKI